MKLQDSLIRASFGLGRRAEAWQMLADFTGTGMEHGRALETAADIYRFRRQKSVSRILLEFRKSLANGSILPPARRFASETDLLMFSGEGKIEAGPMYNGAARVARSQLAFRKAVRSALAGNVVSLAALGILYYVMGEQLFPTISQEVEPALWPFYVRILAGVSYFVAGSWWLVLAAVAAAIGAMTWSTSRWTGPGRALADKVPPWSFYRLQSGLTFLLLLVESARMGLSLTSQWMMDLSGLSGPYVRKRIRGIVERTGSNQAGIGAAALEAGYGWPPNDLSAALAAYSRQDGWVENFSAYLDRWIQQAEAQVNAAAAVLQYIIYAFVAVTVIVTIQAIFSLVQSAQLAF